jgi:SAM-dependent methyltransferase
MNEAEKTNRIRGPAFIEKYLQGKVIDIGAGTDLVCRWAEGFDVDEGDANVITKYRSTDAYDAVHSSHCLEHMHDPEAALLEWWSLLKPGGYLITVVPDEDLYEQGVWPSLFNADHKATFRLNKAASWSPVSYDIRELVGRLPGCEIISAELQDRGYDRSLQRKFGDKQRTIRRLNRIYRVVKRIPRSRRLLLLVQRLAFLCGAGVDQTLGDAVAQIQVVARKRP